MVDDVITSLVYTTPRRYFGRTMGRVAPKPHMGYVYVCTEYSVHIDMEYSVIPYRDPSISVSLHPSAIRLVRNPIGPPTRQWQLELTGLGEGGRGVGKRETNTGRTPARLVEISMVLWITVRIGICSRVFALFGFPQGRQFHFLNMDMASSPRSTLGFTRKSRLSRLILTCFVFSGVSPRFLHLPMPANT